MPSKVKSFGGRTIKWDECESATTDFVQLDYSGWNQKSTWFCKNSGGEYHLYNPYAFCRLEGGNFSEIPNPVYLHGIIPSGGLAKEWELPWIIPDIPTGEYKESALHWAYNMIDNTTKALKNGQVINFPEGKCDSIGCITYNFD